VPFIIRIEGLPTLAVVVDETEGASEKSLKSLTAYRRTHKAPKCVVLHAGTRAYVSATGVLCMPYTWIA
jgi:hypothetical protein